MTTQRRPPIPTFRPRDVLLGGEGEETEHVTDVQEAVANHEAQTSGQADDQDQDDDDTAELVEKVTVYVPTALLVQWDAFRLELRRTGVKVDRGRMIRAAMVDALAHPDRLRRVLKGRKR
jgi:hypothetical protein